MKTGEEGTVQKSRSYSRSWSRSSSSSSSSSVASSSSWSHGGHVQRRRGASCQTRSRSQSSSSNDWSRSRSRPRPRCHRTASRSRCGHRHRRCSPPRQYRAHSRSYSRTPSPYGRHRLRYRSSSRGSRFVSSSRFISSPYRSRSRSRSPVGPNIYLSLDDKRELLRIAQENAAKALGVESLELPVSVRPMLETREQTKSTEGSARSSQKKNSPATGRSVTVSQKKNPKPVGLLQQGKDVETEDNVPSHKTSPTSKVITFSVHNIVAKPSSFPGGPDGTNSRVDSSTDHGPYGQWVPIKARSFPIPPPQRHPPRPGSCVLEGASL